MPIDPSASHALPGYLQAQRRSAWRRGGVLGLALLMHALLWWGLVLRDGPSRPRVLHFSHPLTIRLLAPQDALPPPSAALPLTLSPTIAPRLAKAAPTRLQAPARPRAAIEAVNPQSAASVPAAASGVAAPTAVADGPATPPVNLQLPAQTWRRLSPGVGAAEQAREDLAGLGAESAESRMAKGAAQAGHGDCLKGQYAGAGMGLLSLPFLAYAGLAGKCAK